MISNITINNISYDWKDIEVHIGLVNISPMSISSINYGTNHTIDYDYGREGFAVGRKYGNYECFGELTMDFYDLNSIRRDVIGLFNGVISIDVKIIYHKKNSTYIDTLYGCVLSYPDNYGGSQGDIGLSANIKLNPVWIHYGNK